MEKIKLSLPREEKNNVNRVEPSYFGLINGRKEKLTEIGGIRVNSLYTGGSHHWKVVFCEAL